MDKLFVDGYMILKNVVDKNNIDKLLNSLDEYDLEPRADIEFKEENNETLLSQKMNLNQRQSRKMNLNQIQSQKINLNQRQNREMILNQGQSRKMNLNQRQKPNKSLDQDQV